MFDLEIAGEKATGKGTIVLTWKRPTKEPIFTLTISNPDVKERGPDFDVTISSPGIKFSRDKEKWVDKLKIPVLIKPVKFYGKVVDLKRENFKIKVEGYSY